MTVEADISLLRDTRFRRADRVAVEDVDLCLRLRVLGGELRRGGLPVVHAGQRASRRSLRHGAWHVASLLRLWSRPAYRKARALPQAALSLRSLRGEPS